MQVDELMVTHEINMLKPCYSKVQGFSVHACGVYL